MYGYYKMRVGHRRATIL
jgi:aryl-alcohol dehydrogenase-like predicted oxidoreductase